MLFLLEVSKLAFNNSRALDFTATRYGGPPELRPLDKATRARPLFDGQNSLNGACANQIFTKMARMSLIIGILIAATAFAAHKCVFAA